MQCLLENFSVFVAMENNCYMQITGNHVLHLSVLLVTHLQGILGKYSPVT